MAQVTVKGNGDVLILQNMGGEKPDSDGVQICDFKYFCQSCTGKLLLLLPQGSSGEGPAPLLPKSAPSAPNIRSIHFLFNAYHVVFSFSIPQSDCSSLCIFALNHYLHKSNPVSI